MARCGAVDQRRAAATCLLVFCLAVSAILHFASQTYPDIGRGEVSEQPGISAQATEPALVVGNKIENPFSPDLTPAVFGRLNFLRFLGGNGGLRRFANDLLLRSSVESASEIRGPPHSNSC
jgi:hypothetical protein